MLEGPGRSHSLSSEFLTSNLPFEMEPNKIIVVTGSNRGLGQAIYRLLAQTPHKPPLMIYATSRNAVSLDITPLHDNIIHFEELDITSPSSIHILISKIASPIDVLINNAAVTFHPETGYEDAVSTLSVNYLGTRTICEIFLTTGKMSSNPICRIVNVSALGSSQSGSFDPSICAQLTSPSLTLPSLDRLASEYLESVKEVPRPSQAGTISTQAIMFQNLSSTLSPLFWQQNMLL